MKTCNHGTSRGDIYTSIAIGRAFYRDLTAHSEATRSVGHGLQIERRGMTISYLENSKIDARRKEHAWLRNEYEKSLKKIGLFTQQFSGCLPFNLN